MALSMVMAVRADFSYTTTRKTTGGMMASMAGGGLPQTSKFLLKGQKMAIDNGNLKTIVDFDAQTITSVNVAQKTYTVKSFDDTALPSGTNVKFDVKETGRKKVVNGFDASELVMTMEVDTQQAGPMSKINAEIDMWLSSEVPGLQEMRAFFQRNAGRFPWSAITGGGNPSMQAALAEVQRKMASMNGMQVEQVLRIKAPAGGGAPAGMTPKQAEQAQASRARLEAMKAQGGMQAAMAEKALAMMGGGAAGGGSAGSLIEMTMDSGDFSTNSIPESSFTIPDGYKKN